MVRPPTPPQAAQLLRHSLIGTGEQMRINNISARLITNDWMKKNGFDPVPDEASYESFAATLRQRFARSQDQTPFASRNKALAYIRQVARKLLNTERRWNPDVRKSP